MKFCPFCGAGLQDDMLFCPQCGKRFVDSIKAFDVERKTERQAAYKHKSLDMLEAPQKRKSIFLPVVLSILGLGLVVVALFMAGILQFPKTESTFDATNAANSVLYLELYDSNGEIIGNASGFIVDDGMTLITNYHVINDTYHIVAVTADGSSEVDVDCVLAFDELADLAVLRCNESIGVSPLTFADSDLVKQGDIIYAAGYPLGVANTLSDGIVSSRYVDNGVDTLQITAAISGGSSGGALLNESGEVVGVVCAYYENGQNLNLAIASNEVIKLMKSTAKTTSLQELYIKKYPQAAIEDYYACIRTISVPTKELAEQAYFEWVDSGATEEILIELFDLYGSEQGGGQLHIILPGFWVDEVDQWCFDKSRCNGDIAVIETDYGCTICYFSDAIKVGEYKDTLTGKVHKEALDNDLEQGDISRKQYESLLKALMQADTMEEYNAEETKILGLWAVIDYPFDSHD